MLKNLELNYKLHFVVEIESFSFLRYVNCYVS